MRPLLEPLDEVEIAVDPSVLVCVPGAVRREEEVA